MKAKFIYSVVVLAVLCLGKVNSQIIPSVTKSSLSGNDRAILDQYLSEYVTFTMDKRELVDRLYTDGTCQFQICIDERLNWTIDLEFNDMRAPDFRQTYTTDEGEFEFEEPFVVNTFKGKTSDGQIVRFTIDENTFAGIILCDQYHYEIRQAKNYTRNDADASLIVYRSWDVIESNDDFDYINDAIEASEKDEKENMTTRNSTSSYAVCTWFLRIATDADFQFYQEMGSNLTNAYNRVFSVLNEVEGVYESTFNMKIIITFQNVFTSNTTYTSTNSSTLLDQFRSQWNSNRKSVSRNIAHLFTGKTLDSGVLGIGYKGEIRNPNKNPFLGIDLCKAYSLTRMDANMQYTATHEIGHNLDADHPTSIDCNCGNFNRSVMCQGSNIQNLWFCGQSISEILPFIHDNKSYLTRDLSTSLTLSGTLTGFQSYEATQTITSTQVINSGFTSYKAGTEIVLSPGFHAQAGSMFTATIEDDTDCGNWAPITISSWTNAVCTGTGLQFDVFNAISYTVEIRTSSNIKVYSGGGSITGNPVTVWNVPSSQVTGNYAYVISFYSPSYELSHGSMLYVFNCRDSTSEENDETRKTEIADAAQEDENQTFSFSIFPNPTSGLVTVDYTLHVNAPICIEMYNMFGQRMKLILPQQNKETGEYSVQTSVSDLNSGTYFIRVTSGDQVESKQLIINQ